MKIIRFCLFAFLFFSSIVSADNKEAYSGIYFEQSEALKKMISDPEVVATGAYPVSYINVAYRNGFLFFCDPEAKVVYNEIDKDALMCNGMPMLNAQAFLDKLMGSNMAKYVDVDIVYSTSAHRFFVLKYRAYGLD